MKNKLEENLELKKKNNNNKSGIEKIKLGKRWNWKKKMGKKVQDWKKRGKIEKKKSEIKINWIKIMEKPDYVWFSGSFVKCLFFASLCPKMECVKSS